MRTIPYQGKEAAPKRPAGRGSLVGAKITHVWDDVDDRRHYTRAVAYRVDKTENDLHVVDVDDDSTSMIPLDREGIEWCRGWSGEALRAMKTVIAIGAPPRQHKGMS